MTTKFSPEVQKEWDEWIQSRPEIIQKLARELPPDQLYRMKSTGNIVTMRSYEEDGTVTVNVGQEHNKIVLFDRNVFGLKPSDLEKTEEPTP